MDWGEQEGKWWLFSQLSTYILSSG